MKKFIITEVRKNREGREFCVDTYIEAPSVDDIVERFRVKFPHTFLDKNFKVKELYPKDLWQ